MPHPIGAATYLAFGDDRRLERTIGEGTQPADVAVLALATEFAGVVERIETGQFPPRPRQPADCQWCGYAGVCRKEYRVEDDDAADAV